MRAELDKRAMGVLSAGHCATDFANGALPALLPLAKSVAQWPAESPPIARLSSSARTHPSLAAENP